MHNTFRSFGCSIPLGLVSIAAHAQLSPCKGTAVAGTIHDPSGAIVAEAQVTLDGGAPVGTDGCGRYYFSCVASGRHQGSDFALSFEHRQINNIAVVNAVTLDPSGNPQSVVDSVPIPQTLWLATARNGWQLGSKNTFTAEYSANANHLINQGVGGTALRETGYVNDVYEHDLRISNIALASAGFMHEARAVR